MARTAVNVWRVGILANSFVSSVSVLSASVVEMTVNKTMTTELMLEWSPTCSAADNDYVVYEGTLGNWYDHNPVAALNCTTGGARTATFDPFGSDAYYLVVPHDGAAHGSYGQDSTGTERPSRNTACYTQMLGTCP